MRKILWVAAGILGALLYSTPAQAQCTLATVSGTVTDPNGLVYSGALLQIQLIPNTSTPTCSGGGSPTTFISTTLDINGHFSLQLAENTSLAPSGTQWQFNVNGNSGLPPPVGKGSQNFVYTAAITANVNLSSPLSALATALTVPLAASGSGVVSFTGDGTLSNNSGSTGAVTLTLNSAAADKVYGNCTTGTLAPSYCSIVGAMLPAINLAASGAGGVVNNLPVTNLNSGTAASSTTFWRGDGTWAAPPGTGTVTHTVSALTLNAVVIGNGAADVNVLASLGTTTTLLHGNASGPPSFGAVSLTADVSGNLPVTNLNSGTAASGTTFWRGDGTWATPAGAGTVTHTAGALTANALMVGNGAADATVLASLGTSTTVLHGNASGLPTFGAVSLTADVSGNLPVTNLNSGTAASSSTFWRGDGTWASPAGSGTIVASAQFGIAGYSAAGSATTLTGIPAPTTPNGVPQSLTSTPSGSAATAFTPTLPGLVSRAITGTTATDTIVSTDCNPGRIQYTGSVAVATALPSPTTLAVPNCVFRVANNTTGAPSAVTVTPATLTVRGGSSITIAQGQTATFAVASGGTDWSVDIAEEAISAGTGITLTRSQFGTQINSSASSPSFPETVTGGVSGAVTCFTNTTTLSAGALLAGNGVVLGGGTGNCPVTVAGISTDGTSTLTLGVSGTSTGALKLAGTGTGTLTLTVGSGALGTPTVTIPPATDTLANLAGSQALTNKSVDGVTPSALSVGFSLAGGATSKTLTVSNTMTLAGTDSSTYTFPSASATIAQRVFAGTAALGTSAITSGACATVVTVTATGVASTDVVTPSYNVDPTAVTGYGASATGAVLSIYAYPTSGNVNVKVCNSSANSITPSALTLNLLVTR